MSKISPSIVLDQSCASLLDKVSGLAPTFVFTRRDGLKTDPALATQELYDSLSQSGVGPPYLLVAASFAGFTTLLFAHRFPASVHGVVLVDSSHPRQSAVGLASLPEDLPSRPEIEAFRAFLRGFGPMWERSCRIMSEVDSVGDIPIIAMAAGAPDMPACLPSEVKRNLINGWHSLQRHHARRSSCGEVRIVEGVGHNITMLAPDMVVAAIVDLLKKTPDKAPNQSIEATPDGAPQL